jgi:hypothetical protein
MDDISPRDMGEAMTELHISDNCRLEPLLTDIKNMTITVGMKYNVFYKKKRFKITGNFNVDKLVQKLEEK